MVVGRRSLLVVGRRSLGRSFRIVQPRTAKSGKPTDMNQRPTTNDRRRAAFWARARRLAVCVALLGPLAARAQPPTAPPTPAPTATPAQPVPLPEIAKRADELAVYLQQVEERADPSEVLREFETDLPALADRLSAVRDH